MRNRHPVVGAIALLTLAACAPAPAAPAPTPTPAASPTPTATPSTGATPSATPSAVPSGPGLSGTVYDLDGAPLAGATVSAGEDGKTPTSATTDAAGRYALAGLPAGVSLAVSAGKPGWTTRRRVKALASGVATMDFGAPDFSGSDAAYFLSDLPEVTLTSPLMDGTLADPSGFHLVLSFNAPLDAANRALFAKALRIFPANRAAAAEKSYLDLAETEDKAFPADRLFTGATSYDFGPGDLFRGDLTSPATLTWSADGTQATFDFAARAITDRTDEADYELALVSRGTPIVDANGHQVGTNVDGSFTGYPEPGHLVRSVFQSADLALAAVPGLDGKAARWAVTHDDDGRFRVAPDHQVPRLGKATVSTSGGDTTFAMIFDEPLVAFDGSTPGRLGAGLDVAGGSVMTFTFALSDKPGDLASLTLDGKDARAIDPHVTTSIGGAGDRRTELSFATSALVGANVNPHEGDVQLRVDPKDARRVLLTVAGRSHFIDESIAEFAVRAEGVGDPAGNVIDEDQADAQVLVGVL